MFSIHYIFRVWVVLATCVVVSCTAIFCVIVKSNLLVIICFIDRLTQMPPSHLFVMVTLEKLYKTFFLLLCDCDSCKHGVFCAYHYLHVKTIEIEIYKIIRRHIQWKLVKDYWTHRKMYQEIWGSLSLRLKISG